MAIHLLRSRTLPTVRLMKNLATASVIIGCCACCVASIPMLGIRLAMPLAIMGLAISIPSVALDLDWDLFLRRSVAGLILSVSSIGIAILVRLITAA